LEADDLYLCFIQNGKAQREKKIQSNKVICGTRTSIYETILELSLVDSSQVMDQEIWIKDVNIQAICVVEDKDW